MEAQAFDVSHILRISNQWGVIFLNNYTVYMHISPSNKRYIGITCQKPEQRWKSGHGYKTQIFGRAIEKYGWSNIEHIIVAQGLSEEEAEWLEIELIREWNTTDPDKGYNIAKGGMVNSGYHLREETKQKISKSSKGKQAGKNNPMYGKDWREGKTEEELQEHKRKISEATRGEKNPMYGKDLSGANNPSSKKVRCIETGQVYVSTVDASLSIGKSRGAVSAALKRKGACGGYHWEYVS